MGVLLHKAGAARLQVLVGSQGWGSTSLASHSSSSTHHVQGIAHKACGHTDGAHHEPSVPAACHGLRSWCWQGYEHASHWHPFIAQAHHAAIH